MFFNRLLEKSLDPDSGIRRSDVVVNIQNVFSNSIGRELAVDFVQKKYEDIIKYLGSCKPLVPLLDSLSKYWHTEEHYNLVSPKRSSMIDPSPKALLGPT